MRIHCLIILDRWMRRCKLSNKILKKKEKASLVGMLAKEVDVKEAMKELKDKKQ